MVDATRNDFAQVFTVDGYQVLVFLEPNNADGACGVCVRIMHEGTSMEVTLLYGDDWDKAVDMFQTRDFTEFAEKMIKQAKEMIQ